MPSARVLSTSPIQLPPAATSSQMAFGSARPSGRRRVSPSRRPCSARLLKPVSSVCAALVEVIRCCASAMTTPSAMLASASAATRRSCSIATRSEMSRMIAWHTGNSPQLATLVWVSTGRELPSAASSALVAARPACWPASGCRNRCT